MPVLMLVVDHLRASVNSRFSRTAAGGLLRRFTFACCGHHHENSWLGIATYTLWGYLYSMRHDIKTSCQKRLARIEGQVRGISRMVEEDRYCIDVVTQIAAVRAALRRVEEEILRDHVGHCVEHAIASGNKAEQRRKVEELMSVIGRADR